MGRVGKMGRKISGGLGSEMGWGCDGRVRWVGFFRMDGAGGSEKKGLI